MAGAKKYKSRNIDENGKRYRGTGRVEYREGRTKPYIASPARGVKSKSFETAEEAHKYLDNLLSDSAKLEKLKSSRITFSAYVPVYIEKHISKCKKETGKKDFLRKVEKAEKYVGKMLLIDIDNDVLRSVVNQLCEDGYQAAEMRKIKQTVISVIKSAAADKIIPSIPSFDIIIPDPKSQGKRKRPPTKENWLRKKERKAYEAECARTEEAGKYAKNPGEMKLVHPSGYKLLLILHTGMRIGEALALTWEDYSEDSKTLTINKNVVTVNGKKIFNNTPKTEAGDRVIILNKDAFNDLEKLRAQFDAQTADLEEREKAEKKKAAEKYSGSDLKKARKEIENRYAQYYYEHKYICGATKFPYGLGSDRGLESTNEKICKTIKAKHRVNVHGLRHTYVTWYYLHHYKDPDFALPLFSQSIGHASTRTTMRTYAHLKLEENRSIDRSVDDLKDF